MIGHRDGYRRNMQVFSPDGITETLDTGQGGGRGAYVSINILNKDYNHAHEAVYDTDGIIGTLMARDYKDPKRVCIPVLTPDRAEKHQNGRRFKDDGEPMFTLTGQDRHGVAVEPIGIIDPQGRKTKVVVPKDMVPTLRSQSHGNEPNVCFNVGEDKDSNSKDGIFVKLSAELTVYAVWYEKYQCYIAIRKLTPKECFRLQGWSDDYFEKAQFVNSDSQLYKQAGNGVTVTVIEAIARKMNVDLN
jgi:DNA (cytosine-5)-methyltransferase 1